MIRRILLAATTALLLAGCGDKTSVPNDSPPVKVIAASPQDDAGEKEKKDREGEQKKEPIAPAEVKGEFRFAEDAAGKQLATLLPPGMPEPLSPRLIEGPSPRSLPEYIANPGAFRPIPGVVPPSLPLPASGTVRPRPLPDRVPVDLAALTIEAPGRTVMPDGALTKVESPDINEPVGLPILARPSADRAPLEDPTTEYSTKSVILEVIPIRTEVAPFAKFSLPDPFEFVETARLRMPVPVSINELPVTTAIPKPPEKK